MRALVQRVSHAKVVVEEQTVGEIGQGFLVLLGIGQQDSEALVKALVDKLVHLRVFNDADDKMNLSVLDIAGQILVVSQFTLYADIRKGRRPSFVDAAHPTIAEPLVERFKEAIAAYGVTVAGGIFGAHMQVELVNDGPVTISMDSDHLQR
ncbi:MAG TPA: D-aminoacyl-tRNA deacylase [Dictyobacter sp.]|nr:D-aminoacyl-tRNA deacylase [Dictyobacter sp.]